jgi:hypothetical protein
MTKKSSHATVPLKVVYINDKQGFSKRKTMVSDTDDRGLFIIFLRGAYPFLKLGRKTEMERI